MANKFSQSGVSELVNGRFQVSYGLLAPMPVVDIIALKSKEPSPTFPEKPVVNNKNHVSSSRPEICEAREEGFTATANQIKITPINICPDLVFHHSVVPKFDSVCNRNDMFDMNAQIAGIGEFKGGRKWRICC